MPSPVWLLRVPRKNIQRKARRGLKGLTWAPGKNTSTTVPWLDMAMGYSPPLRLPPLLVQAWMWGLCLFSAVSFSDPQKNQCWCWMIWIPRWYETCRSTPKGNVNSGSFSHVDLWSESLQTVPLTNKRQVTWTLAWHIAFWNPITMSHSTQSRSEVVSYSTRPILPVIWFCNNFVVTQPCALGKAVSFSLYTIITNSYNSDYMAWQGENVFFLSVFQKKKQKVTDLCFRKCLCSFF